MSTYTERKIASQIRELRHDPSKHLIRDEADEQIAAFLKIMGYHELYEAYTELRATHWEAENADKCPMCGEWHLHKGARMERVDGFSEARFCSRCKYIWDAAKLVTPEDVAEVYGE